MKFTAYFFGLLALLMWLTPAVLALVDIGCWLLASGGCTGVEWFASNGARGEFAIVWTAFAGFLFLPMACALFEAG